MPFTGSNCGPLHHFTYNMHNMCVVLACHDTVNFLFQYCNVYVTMPEVQLLLTDPQLPRECLDYVALQGKYTWHIIMEAN